VVAPPVPGKTSARLQGPWSAARTTTGNAWATGAENTFRPADMFEPEALNAAWTDSLDAAVGKVGTLRKRFGLYTCESSSARSPTCPLGLTASSAEP
jgi:hypothetical protein